MAGTFSRRFYQLPRTDASLSSRFGTMPALMEREDRSSHSSRSDYSPFNSHVVLPPIKYRKFGGNSNEHDLPFNIRKPFQPVNSMSHHSVLDHLLCTLLDSNDLPDVPIVITPEQENAILTETHFQLTNFDSLYLRDLYIALTNIDQDLTGCVSYSDLCLTFQRKQIPITEELLKLISSQFISRKEYGKVNYEKILSFIGAAIKMNKPKQEDSHFASNVPSVQRDPRYFPDRMHTPGRPVYYHDQHCVNDEEQPSQVYTERDDPELLRLLESSVRHQFNPINLESLRLSFQRADRLHRGTLSEQQIKELCFHHDVRIEDSIIERIIRRCKQRGGGQYDWQQFVRYLERVQPIQTGLAITRNRMPAELQRYVPHPSSSWPQAEIYVPWGNPIEMQNSHSLPIYKEKFQNENQLPPPLPQKSSHGIQTLTLTDEQTDPLQTRLNQLQAEVADLVDKPVRADVTGAMQKSFSDPAHINSPTTTKESMFSDFSNSEDILNQPWFDRFMYMADQFYQSDFNSTGVLSQNLLSQLTDKWNSKLKLRLKREDIQNAMYTSQRSSGSVDINSYLKLLAVKY